MTAAPDIKAGEYHSLLIGDDDKPCRDSLKLFFEPQGFKTHLASCGREAIEIVQQEVIHVMILDMHMPDLSGIETLKLIKEITANPAPCIFMSADASKEQRLEALSAEAHAVIPKPINLNMIRFVVEQILRKYY